MIIFNSLDWKSIAIFFPFILGLLFSLYLLWGSETQKVKDFQGLTESDQRILENIRIGEGSKTSGLKASLDGKVLWLSSTSDRDGKVYLRLKSKPGEVLSSNQIEIKAEGEMDQGLAFFREFHLVRGDFFSRGRYDYEVDFFEAGPQWKIYRTLFSIPFIGQVFKLFWSESQKEKYAGVFEYFGESKNKFKKDLSQFKKVYRKKKVQALNDQLQKYKALLGMGQKMREKVDELLDQAVRKKKSKKLKEFDQWYARQLAPLTQSLIIDSREYYLSLMKKDILKSNVYRDIHQQGLKLSELASVVSSWSQRKEPQIKETFEGDFQKSIETWSKKVRAKKERLEKKLKQLQGETL